MKKNHNNNDTDFLDNLISNLSKLSKVGFLGEDMQSGTILSKTDEGARTNARIEAAQKGKSFNESETSEKEFKNIDLSIIDELLNREINKIFKV